VTRVPGGSSGGSASAVAGNLALAALGTDTGGSIRQPAAHCGLVGFKPTYGAVSRNGLIALGSSLDQAGPLAKSVEDARILFEAMRGTDPYDATTIRPDTYPKKETPAKFRIGVPRHLLTSGLDEDVLAHFNETLAKLEAEGHTVVEVSLPTSPYALPALLARYGADSEMDVVGAVVVREPAGPLVRFHATGDLVSTTSESHRAVWSETLDRGGNPYRPMLVPPLRGLDLYSWIRQTRPVPHRFLSIDVEGESLELFMACPLDELGVDVAIVEYDRHLDALARYAETRGFRLAERTEENAILVRGL
jgi:hypothetical protein